MMPYLEAYVWGVGKRKSVRDSHIYIFTTGLQEKTPWGGGDVNAQAKRIVEISSNHYAIDQLGT